MAISTGSRRAQRTLRLKKESTRLLDVTAHAAGKSSTVQIASALDAQLAVTRRIRRKLRWSLRYRCQFIDYRLRIYPRSLFAPVSECVIPVTVWPLRISSAING